MKLNFAVRNANQPLSYALAINAKGKIINKVIISL